MAGGIRWSNGANYNDVYDNRIKTDDTGDFSIYMCEFHFDLFVPGSHVHQPRGLVFQYMIFPGVYSSFLYPRVGSAITLASQKQPSLRLLQELQRLHIGARLNLHLCQL